MKAQLADGTEPIRYGIHDVARVRWGEHSYHQEADIEAGRGVVELTLTPEGCASGAQIVVLSHESAIEMARAILGIMGPDPVHTLRQIAGWSSDQGELKGRDPMDVSAYARRAADRIEGK